MVTRHRPQLLSGSTTWLCFHGQRAAVLRVIRKSTAEVSLFGESAVRHQSQSRRHQPTCCHNILTDELHGAILSSSSTIVLHWLRGDGRRSLRTVASSNVAWAGRNRPFAQRLGLKLCFRAPCSRDLPCVDCLEQAAASDNMSRPEVLAPVSSVKPCNQGLAVFWNTRQNAIKQCRSRSAVRISTSLSIA